MTQSSTTLAVACPACGLSHAFRAGAAPARIPHHCPRCGADLVAEGLLEPAAPDAAATDGLPPSAERSAERRTDDEAYLPAPAAWQSAAVAAFAAVLGWSHATRGMLAAVVSGADLVFHEAGHPIVGVLGSRFLTYLGGTIGQLAIPAAAAFAFARRRQTAAYAVALVWIGFNLVNVGTYAADAMNRALPLLASDPGEHDWWNLLGMLGVREHCRGIGGTIAAAGWAFWAGAPAWCGWKRASPRSCRA
jgi:hypothetical protein